MSKGVGSPSKDGQNLDCMRSCLSFPVMRDEPKYQEISLACESLWLYLRICFSA